MAQCIFKSQIGSDYFFPYSAKSTILRFDIYITDMAYGTAFIMVS